MVIKPKLSQKKRHASLMVELLIAIALLTGALLPLAYSVAAEKKLARANYYRAIAMEIVDGEMEILAAGEWRSLSPGLHEYPVRGVATNNLPPGRFLSLVETGKVELQWLPPSRQLGGPVIRELETK